MSGLMSPDVPAYVCYIIVLLFGTFVAVRTVNEHLKTVQAPWAFASTWVLFFAHVALPVLTFWALDYTAVINDTSVFAALLVAFACRLIFSGEIKGVALPAQAAAFWKPFQAWVEFVVKRIDEHNARYIDRFDETIRSRIANDPQRLAKFTVLAQASSGNLPALQAVLLAIPASGNAAVDNRRKVDVMWDDLRKAKPQLYGWLLQQNGIVPWRTYWLWIEKGRAKLVSAAVVFLMVLAIVGVGYWFTSGNVANSRQHTAWLNYYKWRFLKTNATDRDRWRSREYVTRELCNWSDGPGQELTPIEAERRTEVSTILLPSLLRELRYSSVAPAQAREILAVLVNCHSPTLNAVYVPELLESIRTENETVRLETRRALVALAVDYPNAKLADGLAKWEPKKDETPGEIDQRVRQWRLWWKSATSTIPAK